jgi:AraC-like DNA-binding protein
MSNHSFSPAPALSRFVQSFWTYQSEPRPYARARGLPSGTAQLVIDLGGDGLRVPSSSLAGCAPPVSAPTWTRALFNGADTRYLLEEGDDAVNNIVVDFTPGGAYPFFGPPEGELRDAHLPLDALWGMRAVDELRDRLMRAQAPAERCQILEQALLAHLARPLERHPAVTLALRAVAATPRGPVIARLADHLDLTHARFIALFREEVGLSPKQYCRVRRFHRVLLRTWKEPQVDWARVAQECGYCDQAHLTRDFQQFAGVSPGVFLRDRSVRSPSYLLLPSALSPAAHRRHGR